MAFFKNLMHQRHVPAHKLNPGVPEWFSEIIDTCLNMNPVERWASSKALKDALESAYDTQGPVDSNPLAYTGKTPPAPNITGYDRRKNDKDRGLHDARYASVEQTRPVSTAKKNRQTSYGKWFALGLAVIMCLVVVGVMVQRNGDDAPHNRCASRSSSRIPSGLTGVAT